MQQDAAKAADTAAADRRRMQVLLAAGSVLSLAAVVGAMWWMVWRHEMTADGTTVTPAGLNELNESKLKLQEARALAEAGRKEEALKLADEVTMLAEKVVKATGGSHAFGLSARLQLAGADRLRGKIPDAMKTLDGLMTETAFRPAKDGIIPEEEMYTDAVMERARCLTEQGKVEEAVALLRAVEVMKMRQEVCGHKARVGTGMCWELADRYDLARAAYERIREKYEGPEKNWAFEAHSRIRWMEQTRIKPETPSGPAGKAVKGNLSGEVVWKATDGPYDVTETVVVPAGATLRVEAGTRVRFAEGTGLKVAGTLTVAGGKGASLYDDKATPADAVVFESRLNRRGAFGWNGVELTGPAAGGSELRGLIIRGASTGIRVEGCSPKASDVLISRSGVVGVIVTNDLTAKGRPKAEDTSPTFTDVVVETALGAGVEFRGTVSGRWTGGAVRGAGGTGLTIQDSADPVVEGLVITDTGDEGVALLRTAKGRLTGLTVKGARAAGVRWDHRSLTTLTGGEISGSTEAGIRINESAPVIDGVTVKGGALYGIAFLLKAGGDVRNCRITGNAGAGIALDGGSEVPAITGCRITGNETGVRTGDVRKLSITGCRIAGNKVLDLVAETGNSLDAAGNDWGTTDVAEIRKRIKGEVKFEPLGNPLPGE